MTSNTRLFVGRLSSDVQKKDLEALFGKFGVIVNCSMKTTYGFVEFEDARDARDAVNELNGYRLEGSKIAVEFSHGRKSDFRGRDGDRDRERRPSDRDRDRDRDRDSDRERERDRDRDRDRERDRDRGDYEDRDRDRMRRDRDRDRERERDRDYDDRDRDRSRRDRDYDDRDRYRRTRDRDDRDRDRGRRHSSRSSRYSPPYNSEYRLTITNLPQGCSWQDLKDHFRQVGDVCFADVRRERDGKEIGRVEFKRLDDMKEALKKLDNSRFNGNLINVTSGYDSKTRSRSTSRGRPDSPDERTSKRSRSLSRQNSRSPSPKRFKASTSPPKSPRKSKSPSPLPQNEVQQPPSPHQD